MTQIRLHLSDAQDYIVGLIKAKKKLSSKQEAIKYLINKARV